MVLIFHNQATKFEKHSNCITRMLKKEINIHTTQVEEKKPHSLAIGHKIQHCQRIYKYI